MRSRLCRDFAGEEVFVFTIKLASWKPAPETPVVIEGKATPKVLVRICELAPHSAETNRYTRK